MIFRMLMYASENLFNKVEFHCKLLQLCDGMFLFSSCIFLKVINVDDDGNELGSGVMELTENELILYTRKRDSVKWPYLCLRRYGYDSNLFSFESGRRCQTGQGEFKDFFFMS